MTIIIPTWVFWILGGVVGLLGLGLMIFGVMFILVFKDFRINF